MKNFILYIKYDGTKYNGWQKQGNTQNTIQGKLEDILYKLFGRKIEINGSGRTDAGVHARCQVANFIADTDLTPEDITDYFNKYLPEDIAIIKTEISDNIRFHARLNAARKTYVYTIWTDKVPDVFMRKFKYFYPSVLNVEKMKEGAEYLLGKHDFQGFSSLKKTKKSTVREIFSVDIEQDEKNEIRVRICGNGFLYNMVRIITGTLIEIGEGRMNPEDILKVLESKNRELAGFTAPPQGLTLEKVEY